MLSKEAAKLGWLAWER